MSFWDVQEALLDMGRLDETGEWTLVQSMYVVIARVWPVMETFEE